MFRKVSLALVALMLVATGACAKQADETTVLTGDAALAALRSAPDAVDASGSGRFEMTFTVSTPQGSFDMHASGGFTGDQMTMEMDLGAVFEQAAAASGQTVPGGFDQPVQVVVDGTDAYLRWPMLEAITGATGWISMTPDDLGLASSSLGFGTGTGDPSQLLEVLRGTSDDIVELGTEEVRGVATTHLRATVDLDRALAQLPADQRALLEKQLEALVASGTSFQVDVWIDADGLPRRMAIDLSDLADATGVAGSAAVEIDFFDYGEPVEVVVPDAADSTPFSQLMGAFGGVG